MVDTFTGPCSTSHSYTKIILTDTFRGKYDHVPFRIYVGGEFILNTRSGLHCFVVVCSL